MIFDSQKRWYYKHYVRIATSHGSACFGNTGRIPPPPTGIAANFLLAKIGNTSKAKEYNICQKIFDTYYLVITTYYLILTRQQTLLTRNYDLTISLILVNTR